MISSTNRGKLLQPLESGDEVPLWLDGGSFHGHFDSKFKVFLYCFAIL